MLILNRPVTPCLPLFTSSPLKGIYATAGIMRETGMMRLMQIYVYKINTYMHAHTKARLTVGKSICFVFILKEIEFAFDTDTEYKLPLILTLSFIVAMTHPTGDIFRPEEKDREKSKRM